jgi:hypothetical protein
VAGTVATSLLPGGHERRVWLGGWPYIALRASKEPACGDHLLGGGGEQRRLIERESVDASL